MKSHSSSSSFLSPLEMTILDLDNLFKKVNLLREALKHTDYPLNPAFGEDFSFHTQQIDSLSKKIRDTLEMLLLYPPHHGRHLSKLENFHRVASFEESIFIMTKFPEGDSEADDCLRRVIRAVSDSVKDCGFYPRIASDVEYHKLLWDNVELYLLGCSKGIAILEDCYKPELNPNVAMEWGWMRGMGRDVLFLVEDGFKYFRADWAGLLDHRFSWDKPEEAISCQIKEWLKGKV